MKKMKYRIVKDIDMRDLEKKVNSLILKGWKPIGGLCVSGIVKMQTMIMDDEDE